MEESAHCIKNEASALTSVSLAGGNESWTLRKIDRQNITALMTTYRAECRLRPAQVHDRAQAEILRSCDATLWRMFGQTIMQGCIEGQRCKT